MHDCGKRRESLRAWRAPWGAPRLYSTQIFVPCCASFDKCSMRSSITSRMALSSQLLNGQDVGCVQNSRRGGATRPTASKTLCFSGRSKAGKSVRPTASTGFLERAMGIEPTSEAWKVSRNQPLLWRDRRARLRCANRFNRPKRGTPTNSPLIKQPSRNEKVLIRNLGNRNSYISGQIWALPTHQKFIWSDGQLGDWPRGPLITTARYRFSTLSLYRRSAKRSCRRYARESTARSAASCHCW
jgi:hypothetical protein